MRITLPALVMAGAMAMTGCSSLVSLNPFVTDAESALDPRLLGVWSDKDDESTYIVRQDGAGYAIAYLEKSAQPIKFGARMLAVGDARLLDLVSANDDPFLLQVHTILRVWPEGSTLRMAFLDSGWLKDRAARELPTAGAKDRTLIVAPGDAVRKFLLKYGADDQAYANPGTLQKAL